MKLSETAPLAKIGDMWYKTKGNYSHFMPFYSNDLNIYDISSPDRLAFTREQLVKWKKKLQILKD